jgi:hypothetical protein
MFGDFTATDRWTKKQVHCVYQALIVAIATRHADAVDVKFLVDGKTVWVALPHPAWVEYKKRSGKAITDSLAVEIAGHYLQAALAAGEGLGREMYSLDGRGNVGSSGSRGFRDASARYRLKISARPWATFTSANDCAGTRNRQRYLLLRGSAGSRHGGGIRSGLRAAGRAKFENAGA